MSNVDLATYVMCTVYISLIIHMQWTQRNTLFMIDILYDKICIELEFI